MTMNRIVLFDGDCNFCDKSVQFIIKRDPRNVFTFASQQSETGKILLKLYDIPDYIDSMVLIENSKVHLKSSAALHIAKQLNGLWKFAYLFMIVPRPIRDFVYDKFAENRYKWFGKKQVCTIPSPEMRKRFLS